ncbi:MAG: RHS repeat-associated core domain-containing protein, partial [bacterium]
MRTPFEKSPASPTLGRWLERDPAGYVDGMGLYEYVRGGPIAAVDPSGLSTATGDKWWRD